jgi:hypothetical protein
VDYRCGLEKNETVVEKWMREMKCRCGKGLEMEIHWISFDAWTSDQPTTKRLLAPKDT